SALMDFDHFMPPSTQVGANTESMVLSDESEAQLYQAYCVTEALSRHPSPQLFTPRPIHPRRSFAKVPKNDLQPESNITLILISGVAMEQESNLGILLGREIRNNGRQRTSNQISTSMDTIFINGNHIPQAVTPCGSQPVAGCQSLVCNPKPSHPQMLQTLSTYASICQAFRRTPLSQPSHDAGTNHCPLPLRPAG
ncbi:hypothetical protein GQ44DRAFT_556676, partial [Phaeosphaeriaceae sp. PMI808]